MGDACLSYLTTQISKAQNALAVSDDNDLDAPLRPVLQHFKDLPPEKVYILPVRRAVLPNYTKLNMQIHNTSKEHALVLEADVQPLRAPVDAPVLLASLADRRRVDHGEQLLDVVDQELVEQPLISLLEKECTMF